MYQGGDSGPRIPGIPIPALKYKDGDNKLAGGIFEVYPQKNPEFRGQGRTVLPVVGDGPVRKSVLSNLQRRGLNKIPKKSPQFICSKYVHQGGAFPRKFCPCPKTYGKILGQNSNFPVLNRSFFCLPILTLLNSCALQQQRLL